jgi:hypothetical protein
MSRGTLWSAGSWLAHACFFTAKPIASQRLVDGGRRLVAGLAAPAVKAPALSVRRRPRAGDVDDGRERCRAACIDSAAAPSATLRRCQASAARAHVSVAGTPVS